MHISTQHHTLRITPMGGVEQIGINMTVYEYDNDILIVDAGFGFPERTRTSVKYMIPNYTWLAKNKHRIRGLIVTHAHLDHIGAIPYILPHLGHIPIYSLPLSIGYIQQRLQEFNLGNSANLCTVSPQDVLHLGVFTVEFFRVNHNIPDSVGVCISSPIGRVIHTGDWKFDPTPVEEQPAEIGKLAEWGGDGVLALLSDSTNAKATGYCFSERTLGKMIDDVISTATGRVLFTCNSLLLARMQQVFNSAEKHNRKVLVIGRSMSQNIETALRLARLHASPKLFLGPKSKKYLPDHQLIILTTGAQGEEMSGLPRMSRQEHRQIQTKSGDTVVISARPIPGNERVVAAMVDKLQKQGVHVVYNDILDIHVSGHAKRDEHRLMMGLTKPKYLIPIHGERHMLHAHAQIAHEMDIPSLLPFNGDTVVFSSQTEARIETAAINAQPLYIDEVGHGLIPTELLNDQDKLRDDGMCTIIIRMNPHSGKLMAPPEVISRGFIYMKGNEDIIREVKHEVRKICENKSPQKSSEPDYSFLRQVIRDQVGEYLFQKTNRRPMVLPVVIEV